MKRPLSRSTAAHWETPSSCQFFLKRSTSAAVPSRSTGRMNSRYSGCWLISKSGSMSASVHCRSRRRAVRTSSGTLALLMDRRPGHFPLKLRQPHRTEVQDPAVKGLEVEALALRLSFRLTHLEEDALAELVGDRLARPAEVTIDLAPHEIGRLIAVLDGKRQHQLRRPALTWMVSCALRNGELEMRADVEDHARRPKGLAAQHAELVVRVLQIAELAHQALGVKGPSLREAGHLRRQSLERIERAGQIDHLAKLQMMARDTLVKGGRHFAPEREASLSQRGVPGSAGAREVFRGPGVVHGGGATRRRDHRLDPLDRIRNVKVRAVELADGLIHQLLQPSSQAVFAFQRSRRISLEQVQDRTQRCTARNARGDLGHSGLDAMQFVPHPGVGLVRIERHAEKGAGGEGVALPANRVLLGGPGRVVLAQESSRRGIGGGCG